MKKALAAAGTIALLAASILAAQAPAPAAKQPAPKSKGESQAVQAIGAAADPDSRIQAVEDLLTKYADTEFKGWALMVATESCRQKNDFEKMMVYGERTLEADPKSYMVMLMMARPLAEKTREFDLDKEEKLSKAEKYANSALEILKTAPKYRPEMTDEQWNALRNDLTAQGHEALGVAATVRKKYDVAISELKAALEAGPVDPAITMARLGRTYNLASKPDDAITILNKVMAMPECQPGQQDNCVMTQVKQYAQAERARAMQTKAKMQPAAPAPAAPAAPATPAAPPAPADPKKP